MTAFLQVITLQAEVRARLHHPLQDSMGMLKTTIKSRTTQL